MNNVVTWNRNFARDPWDIADPMVRGMRQACIAGWFPSLCQTGLSVFDAAGRGYDSNSAANGFSWTTSPWGPALLLDSIGASQYIGFAAHATAYPFTAAGWYCATATNDYLFDAGGSSAATALNHCILSSGGGEDLALNWRNAGNSSLHSVVVESISTPGQWVHAAVICGGSYWDIYANGVLGTHDTAATTTWDANTNRSAFGCRYDKTPQYSGTPTLGPWQLFQGALSASQIRRLYQDPHCLVRKTRRWLPVAVAGTGPTTIRWPWQNRRRRRMAGVR